MGGGEGGRPEGPPPLRILTSVCTVLDYVGGTGHRPKSSMEPFSLLHVSSYGKGEFIVPDCPSNDTSHNVA